MDLGNRENNENILLEIRKGGPAQDAVIAAIYNDRVIVDTLKKWVFGSGGNTQDAEDILQESILAFLKNVLAEKFEGRSSARTYILKIVWFKNQKRFSKKDLIFPAFMNDGNEELITEDLFLQTLNYKTTADRIKCYEIMMSQLDEQCKELLTMFYFHKMKMKEIAAEKGYTNVQSAKNKADRCRKKLRKIGERDEFVMGVIGVG